MRLLAIVAVACACLAPMRLAWTQSSISEIDRIVAIVNDDVIVMSELDARVSQVRAQLIESGTPAPPYQVLQKQVLERLIVDRLQLQVADQTGIRVTEDALNAAINNLAENNGLTLRQFRDVLRNDGFDFGQFREQVRDQIRISQVRQRSVGDQIVVSERDVDNFLSMQARLGDTDTEYHLGHILISVPDGASADEIAQAREEATRILEALRDGADFAQTAVQISSGQQALNGGDLGWKKASQLPTIFTPVVPTLAVGQVSDVIKSPNGFHIVKLIDSRGASEHIVTQTLSRHILIRPNELVSDEDAEIRLKNLAERIANGEDFGALAKAHSDDRASAINNGELGWLNPGDVIPKFEEVQNSLAPGEVSAPFKTQFGWHIVQVIERRSHDNTETIVRAQAREAIRERKMEEEGQAWLRQLRDSAYVEFRLDSEDNY